jgi:hypothetical protein
MGDDAAAGGVKPARESVARPLRQSARFDPPSSSGEATR